MADNHNLSEMIKSSLEGISCIADSNTVIGDPIETKNGITIIPVSKLSMGFASGGLDYHAKVTTKGKDTEQKGPSKNSIPCFGGGGGTGISVTPVCFLVIDKEGKVQILNVETAETKNSVVGIIDSVSSLVDKAPEVIAEVKKAFAKKNMEKTEEEELLK